LETLPDIDPNRIGYLRRDPGDARVHTALGITDFTRARYTEAEKLFVSPGGAISNASCDRDSE
jgi:hypothetical protein